MRWPRLTLPADRRVHLISIIGSAVIVVLVATAVAVWLNSTTPPGGPTAPGKTDPYGLQRGAQEGSSPSALSRPSATEQPLPAPSAVITTGASAVASASYRTSALLGLGGFDTEVTVHNPGRAAWQVVLTMPQDRSVENRSTNQVKMSQDGVTVTLTPVSPEKESLTFTIRFPALLALGMSVTGCTIDGKACSGS